MTNISKAIGMHLRGLRADGLPLPLPKARAEYFMLQKASLKRFPGIGQE
jgi:hypothetical protein